MDERTTTDETDERLYVTEDSRTRSKASLLFGRVVDRRLHGRASVRRRQDKPSHSREKTSDAARETIPLRDNDHVEED